jgi:hypothetical protein
VNVFSSGGGVQSTACLVLSAQGKIDYPIHVFANVGHQAESPQTIWYVRDVLKPYAESNGIKWVEVCKKDREGMPVDLYEKVMSSPRSIPLPVRMADSGAPGTRACTIDWKIQPVAKYLKGFIPLEIIQEHRKLAKGWRAEARRKGLKKPAEINREIYPHSQKFYKDNFPIVLGKGISTDESQRANPDPGIAHYSAAYPLIELGLSRMDCYSIARDAGLPEPPKSACFFCPYTNKPRWQDLRQNQPDLFWKAVEMEKILHKRSAESLGRGGCYFTSTGTSRSMFLDEVTSPHLQVDLFHGFDDDECESGHCWT